MIQAAAFNSHTMLPNITPSLIFVEVHHDVLKLPTLWIGRTYSTRPFDYIHDYPIKIFT